MNWNNKLVKYGVAAGAFSSILAVAWPVLSYSELYPILAKSYNIAQVQTDQQLEEMSKAILHLKYMNLLNEKNNGGLSFNDQQEFCRIARVLGYTKAPGCE